jgi:hypothetical protein
MEGTMLGKVLVEPEYLKRVASSNLFFLTRQLVTGLLETVWTSEPPSSRRKRCWSFGLKGLYCCIRSTTKSLLNLVKSPTYKNDWNYGDNDCDVEKERR